VAHNSLAEFSAAAEHPFLIGKDFYDGELKNKIGGTLATTSTMKFSTAGFRKKPPASEEPFEDEKLKTEADILHPQDSRGEKQRKKILKSIFLMKKKGFQGSLKEGYINIGRGGMNDIVISDPVISGKHARIEIYNGTYFVEDRLSTNSTFVNSTKLKQGEKKQLHLNDELAFGRIVFVFAHPLQVYRAMRKDLLGY
jgi:hypothetical protein